jgi:hypothetical protein
MQVELRRSRSLARRWVARIVRANRARCGRAGLGCRGGVVRCCSDGEGVVEDVKGVACMWVKLGGWTSVGVLMGKEYDFAYE